MSRRFDRSVLTGAGLLLTVLFTVAVAYRNLTAAVGVIAAGAVAGIFLRSRSARQQASADLHKQQEWLRATLASTTDAVIATDAAGKVTFLNPAAATLTGWTPEEAQGQPLETVFRIVHEKTRTPVASPVERVQTESREGAQANDVILVARNGVECPIQDRASPIRDETGKLSGVVLAFRDDSEQRRAEALLTGQKKALELMVHGAPLGEVLETLCATVEAEAGMPLVATILLADEEVTCLRAAARGRCPKEYASLLNPIPVGPRHGSCGTAAYRGERVIVADIASDPLWADWPAFRDLALCYRLRACWSTPILSSAGKVLGTFAVYHRAPRQPTAHDLHLVDVMAHTASIAIERHRAGEARSVSVGQEPA
jgi:PAS domain S-box-containing protein